MVRHCAPGLGVGRAAGQQGAAEGRQPGAAAGRHRAAGAAALRLAGRGNKGEPPGPTKARAVVLVQKLRLSCTCNSMVLRAVTLVLATQAMAQC